MFTHIYHPLYVTAPFGNIFPYIYITHLMLPHTRATFSHIHISHLMLSHTWATFSHIYHPYTGWVIVLCYHTLGQHFPIYTTLTLAGSLSYVITHLGNIFPYIPPLHWLGHCLMLSHTWATFSHIYHPYTGWVIVSCPSHNCFNPITCVTVSQPLGFQQPDNHTGPSKGNWWQGIYIIIHTVRKEYKSKAKHEQSNCQITIQLWRLYGTQQEKNSKGVLGGQQCVQLHKRKMCGTAMCTASQEKNFGDSNMYSFTREKLRGQQYVQLHKRKTWGQQRTICPAS